MAGDFEVYFRKQEGECSSIEVHINTGAKVQRSWYVPKIDVGSGVAAEFVAGEIQRRLREMMRDIRENAYNKGWRDAKKRKKKREIFPSSCSLTWFEKDEKT